MAMNALLWLAGCQVSFQGVARRWGLGDRTWAL